MSEDGQCEFHDHGLRCMYVVGHGGEHNAPRDGKDHTDEMRIRVLRDNRERLDNELVEARRTAHVWKERAEKAEADNATLTERAEAAEAILKAVREETQGEANFGKTVELLFYGPLREAEGKVRTLTKKCDTLELREQVGKDSSVFEANNWLADSLRAAKDAARRK